MKKALIIYGSETGNTKAAAEIIAGALRGMGFEAVIENVVDASVEELSGEQDLTLLGSSTWGAVKAETQRDFQPFFEAMGQMDLTGRKVAVFGCGQAGWDVFAKAVDAVEAKARDLGAELVIESLKIDGSPLGDQAEIEAWAARAAARA